MDPNETYSRLLDAVKNGPNNLSVQEETVELAEALYEWIKKDGFLPKAMMTGGWNKRAALVFLSAFINAYSVD